MERMRSSRYKNNSALLWYGEKSVLAGIYAGIVCTKQTRSNIGKDSLRNYASKE